MTDSAVPLDGALVAFLLRVLDHFERTASNPDALLASLKGVGLDDAAVKQLQAFVTARESDFSRLSADLPKLLAVLDGSNPDLLSLIAPAKDLWGLVTGLIADAPKLSAADMPRAPALPNGDVLGQLVTLAVDRALRDASTSVWAALCGAGFVGPGASILSALSAAIHDPAAYLWQQFQALRRQNTLSIAGILTGPRVISTASVSLAATQSPSPEAVSALGADAVVFQRLVLKLASDTYGKPVTLSLDIVGTETIPPTFVAAVLSAEATVAPIPLGPLLQLSFDPPNVPFAIALTGFGTVKQIAGSPPNLTLGATTSQSYKFGSVGGIHLSLQQPVFEVVAGLDSWGASVGVTGFEITIPKAVAGDLLGIFLPDSGIVLKGKLLFKVDSGGFHFDGGVGLSAKWPDTVRLPGVVIHSLQTSVAASGSDFPLSATGTVVVSLGPVTATIEGFGISQPIRLTTDGSGNLGIIDLQPPSFATPTGIGIAVDASVVKGGGFLHLSATQISGALELAISLGSTELSVQAFGVIERINGDLSFIVVMSVSFAPPIEIFLGLTLNAIGGVFGFNRTVDSTALGGLVRDGRTDDVLIPHDLIQRADLVLAALSTTFPAKSGQYLAAPILELGWGRPVSLVTMTAGVVFTFPNPAQIVIVGELRIELPKPDAPIVNLQADFAGTIDRTTGNVSFDASLARSKIGNFDVVGDLALRAGPQGFVFSAGGFNPSFTPPPDLGKLRRLAISISPSPILQIAADAYFALTASTVQFGAALYVQAKLGPIGAKGHVSLDTLIVTAPTVHFTATISGEFQLTVGGDEIASMNVDVLLEGPGHWHARAQASISLFFFSISGTLELAWGSDAAVELGPPVDVAQAVHDALAADATWSHVLPAADAGTVQLRSGAAALHPLGLLRLTQTAAPLDVGLARFGESAVSSSAPVTVTFSAVGAVVSSAQELFATSQFFELSDEERLSKPAYLPFDAGAVVQGDDWQVSDAQTAAVVYEESLGDDDIGAGGPRNFRLLDAIALGWTQLGAAGRVQASFSNPSASKVGVRATTYTIADAATGAPVSSGAAAAVAASTRRSADTVAVADFELQQVA